MTKEEKETIINWNMAEPDKANVYTCQPGIWKKLERLGFVAIHEYKQTGKTVAKEFMIPRNYVKLGKPRKGRVFVKNALHSEVLAS